MKTHKARGLTRLSIRLAACAILVAAPEGYGISLDRDRVILTEEFVGNVFPSFNHAPAITQAADGSLIVAWYGGYQMGKPDTSIWLARNTGTGWTEPIEIDNGQREDGEIYATWDPVLLTVRDGTIYLFYKISSIQDDIRGYSNWWGAVKVSADDGVNWSDRKWLPEGPQPYFKKYTTFSGPTRNQPLELPDGTLLIGSHTESPSWKVHFELVDGPDYTTGYHLVGPIGSGAIQPAFIVHSPDYSRLQIICRPSSSSGNPPKTAFSCDMGQTWTALQDLEGINTCAGLTAATLKSGWHVLAFNPECSRTPLSVALSKDGINWYTLLPELDMCDSLSVDYPSTIEAYDGKIHLVYAYANHGRIKHVVLDTDYLVNAAIMSDYGLAGDFDRDQDVDFFDYAILSRYWQEVNCACKWWCGGADIDRGGCVDFFDLAAFAANWLGQDN